MKCKLPKRIVPISLKFYPNAQQSFLQIFFYFSFSLFFSSIHYLLILSVSFVSFYSSTCSLLFHLHYCSIFFSFVFSFRGTLHSFFLVFLLSFSLQRLRHTKPLYLPSQTVDHLLVQYFVCQIKKVWKGSLEIDRRLQQLLTVCDGAQPNC